MKSGEASPSFEILAPAAWTAPAVFNSPHSGRAYSDAFLALSRLPLLSLRKSEDSYIDELFEGCLEHGAPLLRAHAPRSFIDLNREPFELDPRMFQGELPGYVNSGSPRVAGGLGTIPRIVAEGEEIYRGRLSFAEAVHRIDRIYRPYHRSLAALLEQVAHKTGAVLLVDCHSMPSSAAGHVVPVLAPRVDVVLGDRFGASCSEAITAYVHELLRSEGLTVVRNKPYAGGFITHNYGAPQSGRHALQVEINRGLYMNEATFAKRPGFAELQAALTRMAGRLLRELSNLLESPGRQLAAE
jgi:N-formylglutamate amidohydrolase